MKRILVPVDLSYHGDIAVNIANKLGNDDTEIVILNIIPTPGGAVLLENGQLKDDQEFDLSEYKNRAMHISTELDKRYASTSNRLIRVTIGDINNVILSQIQAESFDLLILGMTGHLVNHFWSESHVNYLSKHAPIPVLTLKCDRSNMNMDQIVFASDFLKNEKVDLNIIRDLAEHFNSKIILLKVVTNDQQRSDESILATAQEFAVSNHLTNFEIKIHQANNVEEGIATFCEENHIDLIALGTHQRNGFSTLFRKSISHDIVEKLYHPIITIPIERK